MAKDLGVDTSGIKADLERRISQYLDTHYSEYAKDDRYASYLSPAKSQRKSLMNNTPSRRSRRDEEDDASKKHSPEIEYESEDEEEEEEEDEQEIDKQRMINVVKQQLETVQERAGVVVDYIAEFSNSTRNSLTNVVVINGSGVVLELLLVIATLVPFTGVIPFPFFMGGLYIEFLPNLTILTSVKLFWQPFLIWLGFSVCLPLITGYYINFTTQSITGRRQSRTKQHHQMIDPLIFAVSRMVFAYVLYNKAIPKLGFEQYTENLVWLIHSNGPILHYTLGNLPYISGAVGAIVALYAATI
jgi:hypothetical protein